MIPANQLSPIELAGILREAGLPYKSRSHADLINDVTELRANEEPPAGFPASNAEEDDWMSEDNPLKDTVVHRRLGDYLKEKYNTAFPSSSSQSKYRCYCNTFRSSFQIGAVIRRLMKGGQPQLADLDSGQVYVDAADLRDYLGKLDPDTHSETLQNFKDEIADFRRAIIDRFDIIGFASLLYKDLAGDKPKKRKQAAKKAPTHPPAQPSQPQLDELAHDRAVDQGPTPMHISPRKPPPDIATPQAPPYSPLEASPSHAQTAEGLPDVQCSWAALSATLSPDDQLCDHTHPEFPQEPCDVCRSHATSHACTFTGGLRLAEILRTDRVKLPDHCCFLCAVMKVAKIAQTSCCDWVTGPIGCRLISKAEHIAGDDRQLGETRHCAGCGFAVLHEFCAEGNLGYFTYQGEGLPDPVFDEATRSFCQQCLETNGYQLDRITQSPASAGILEVVRKWRSWWPQQQQQQPEVQVQPQSAGHQAGLQQSQPASLQQPHLMATPVELQQPQPEEPNAGLQQSHLMAPLVELQQSQPTEPHAGLPQSQPTSMQHSQPAEPHAGLQQIQTTGPSLSAFDPNSPHCDLMIPSGLLDHLSDRDAQQGTAAQLSPVVDMELQVTGPFAEGVLSLTGRADPQGDALAEERQLGASEPLLALTAPAIDASSHQTRQLIFPSASTCNDMFPDVQEILANPAVLPQAFQAAYLKMGLMEMEMDQMRLSAEQTRQGIGGIFNEFSDLNQRMLAKLSAVGDRAGFRGPIQAMQPISAAAAAQPPSSSQPSTAATPRHLVAERIRGPGHGTDIIFIYRFWSGPEVNGEIPSSGMEGPVFIPADAIELCGPADTREGIKQQAKKIGNLLDKQRKPFESEGRKVIKEDEVWQAFCARKSTRAGARKSEFSGKAKLFVNHLGLLHLHNVLRSPAEPVPMDELQRSYSWITSSPASADVVHLCSREEWQSFPAPSWKSSD